MTMIEVSLSPLGGFSNEKTHPSFNFFWPFIGRKLYFFGSTLQQRDRTWGENHLWNCNILSSWRDQTFYSQYVRDGEESLFSIFYAHSKMWNIKLVFVNKTVDRETLCDNTKRLFFTNNYRKLLSDDKYYGALFWNKSRPNIVFIKNRLDKKAIVLPSTFNQFIEGI